MPITVHSTLYPQKSASARRTSAIRGGGAVTTMCNTSTPPPLSRATFPSLIACFYLLHSRDREWCLRASLPSIALAWKFHSSLQCRIDCAFSLCSNPISLNIYIRRKVVFVTVTATFSVGPHSATICNRTQVGLWDTRSAIDFSVPPRPLHAAAQRCSCNTCPRRRTTGSRTRRVDAKITPCSDGVR